MNILYASNNKFISIMLTSIVSLLENTEQKISLYIIDDDISEKNKNIIKKRYMNTNMFKILFLLMLQIV